MVPSLGLRHSGRMDLAAHTARLEAEGQLLAAAAERGGLRAAVPRCSPWQTRDLLRHVGYVHRWAAGYVAGARTEPVPELPEADQLTGGPPDADLLDWFGDGHGSLVKTLRTATQDVSCWTFLPAPSPLAFWARRQAHETAIHRADAQAAAGEVADYPPWFAADGVDELIMGFAARWIRANKAGEEAERSLLVRAVDADGEWTV